MDLLTKPNDDWLRHNPFWIVRLSNGTYVYQNDNQKNSWLVLKDYLRQNNLKIIEFAAKFRDHQENMPPDKDGYFFIKSLIASYGGDIQYFYKLGYLEDEMVNIRKYSVPELIEFNDENESIAPDDVRVVECLIRNK